MTIEALFPDRYQHGVNKFGLPSDATWEEYLVRAYEGAYDLHQTITFLKEGRNRFPEKKPVFDYHIKENTSNVILKTYRNILFLFRCYDVDLEHIYLDKVRELRDNRIFERRKSLHLVLSGQEEDTNLREVTRV